VKYDVIFREEVIDLLIEWEPPESVLDELERLVDEQLAADPVGCLRRISMARAMQYSCSILEREHSRTHVFFLRVHYGEDEKTIFVYDAFYIVLDR